MSVLLATGYFQKNGRTNFDPNGRGMRPWNDLVKLSKLVQVSHRDLDPQ